MLISFLVAAQLAAADSVVYPVLNHERVAGSMIVSRHGDTTTVRYVFTDRNRGSRTVERHIVRDGRVISTEVRPVLPNDAVGDATLRVELQGDTVRRWTSSGTAAEAIKPDVYYATGASPFDQAMTARYLLGRPRRMSMVPGNDSAW